MHHDHPARDIPSLADAVARIDELTTPDRWHPSPAVAQRIALDAAHEGYQAGRHDAIRELMTTADVAAALGVTVGRVRQLARARGAGWEIGRDWLFRPEDVDALRDRRPGRPRRS